MLAVTAIIIFCIVPIATTRAMPQQLQGNETVVSNTIIELSNPLLKDNVLTYGNQESREIMMAQDDTSKYSPNPYVKRQGNNDPDEKRQGNSYPHVMRRGNGRSTMGDKVAADNNSDNEDDENEDLEDDSSAKFNKDL